MTLRCSTMRQRMVLVHWDAARRVSGVYYGPGAIALVIIRVLSATTFDPPAAARNLGERASALQPTITRARLRKQVGHVWRKTGVLRGCGAEAGFVLGGWAVINKLAHRMTGWERIPPQTASTGTGAKCRPGLAAVNRLGGRVVDALLGFHLMCSRLGSLVAIRAEGTLGVAALPCRPEQGVGKLGANEDHRNSALKSRNNKIQNFDS